MATKRRGDSTIEFSSPPVLLASYALVGPKEGEGPLGPYFDHVLSDAMLGHDSPEKAEQNILELCINKMLQRENKAISSVQYFIAGDLLNQIISSTFTARQLGIPYVGIFSACATFAEGLGIGAMFVDGSYADSVVIATASHYQTAERQFRYPVELNIQHKQSNHFTVTGAGAILLGSSGAGAKLTAVTYGTVVDLGIKDPNDMGSAMAPAAVDTLLRHLSDMGRTVGDYDVILTGDLGQQGSKMFRLLAKDAGLSLGKKHQDAGCLIFNPQQKAGAGGSGSACSAVATSGYLLKEMHQGRYHRALLIGTGCLLSTVSQKQGETLPGIGHAVVLEST